MAVTVRQHTFNSLLGRELAIELDAELLSIYPDVLPGGYKGTPHPDASNADEVVFLIATAPPSNHHSGKGPADQVLGCVTLTTLSPETLGLPQPINKSDPAPLKIGSLQRMYVRLDFRGAGVSSLLLAALEEHAKNVAKMDRVLLFTGPRQLGALALYRKRGWTDCAHYGKAAEHTAENREMQERGMIVSLMKTLSER